MGYCLGVWKDEVPVGYTVKDDSAKRASIGNSFTRRHMGQLVFIQLTVKPLTYSSYSWHQNFGSSD